MSAVPDFPNRTNFVIARFCPFARSSAAIGGARDENASKHDDYHIIMPKTLAAIAAQIRERHGVTRCLRKYALPEISMLHRFASI
ncbi:hypothetical protein GGD63_007052 [Bradyrhizobium sp. cir1]|uniref:hypothetical protein n=1 Tax=Bradyrhizobium sp. cir1 TaxID=1445730 RepID=UPI001606D1F2|nr:hypothetical protein [Bradyrhizobium sp. cir1]MBB4374223.1 hypothetical protein [Bradyrhizobium sp. cir1]